MIEIVHALLLLSLRLTLARDASPARANTIAADPQESAEPAESVPPALRAQELYHARELESALPMAEAAADRAWRDHGGDDYQTIAAEEFVAHLAALNKDPERARAIRQENDGKLERLGNPALIEKVRITRAEDYHDTAEPEGK